MIHFLDTDTCIFAMRRSCPVVGARIVSMKAEWIKVPAVVMGELVCGALKSPRTDKSMQAVEEFLRPFEIVPYCSRCALSYGRIRADLEKRGTEIGPTDLLIAATALAHGGTLVTHNVREFQRIEGLPLQDWTD